MQASLPATPQTPAATSLPLPGQAASGPHMPPALPQFDAAMVKAMADTLVKPMTGTAVPDQPAVAVAVAPPAANPQTVPTPAAASPTVAMPQMLPLTVPDPSVGTEQVPPPASHTATTTTRKSTTPDRQLPTRAGQPSKVAPTPSPMPLVQGMPWAGPPTDPGTPPQPAASPRPASVAIADVSAMVGKAADSAPPHLAAASPAELQSPAPDGPSLAAHDAIDAAGFAPPVQPAPQVAAEPSLAMLPVSAEPPAAVPAMPTAPASPRPTVASPAEQVAPVLVSMAHAPDGTQRLTLRLDPPELGHLQIRVERPPDAPANVDITVEKPETLTLLLRDQPQLQRALDQAGVPPDGRIVTFHVAPAEPGSRYEVAPAPGGSGTGWSGAGDASSGAFRQGGRPARDRFPDTDDTKADFAVPVPPAWARAGLDITA
jgi:flagellar hook-length control protein FliK